MYVSLGAAVFGGRGISIPSSGPTYGGGGRAAGATAAAPRTYTKGTPVYGGGGRSAGAAPAVPAADTPSSFPFPTETSAPSITSGDSGGGGGGEVVWEPAPESPATAEVPEVAPGFRFKLWHLAVGAGLLYLIVRRR